MFQLEIGEPNIREWSSGADTEHFTGIQTSAGGYFDLFLYLPY